MNTNNKHTKWEYKNVSADFLDLNALGGEGWELCSFETVNGLRRCILKRPKIDVVKYVAGGNAVKHESKLIAIFNPTPIKVGDWVVALSKNGDIKWSKSYLVSEITEDKISVWYEKKEYPYSLKNNTDDFSKFKVAPKGFPKCEGSYNPNKKEIKVVKEAKKINPKNPNNIRKGDWVAINVYSNHAYEVLSVKNGLLTMRYLRKPYTGWGERLKTVYKVKAKDFKNKTKVKIF